MNPQHRRIGITLAILAFAAGLVLLAVYGGPGNAPPIPAAPRSSSSTTPTGVTGSGAPADDQDALATSNDDGEQPAAADPPDETPPPPVTPMAGLHSLAPETDFANPADLVLGSLDPSIAKAEVRLTATGAGVESIKFSEIWETAPATRTAKAHHRARLAGNPNPPPLPPETDRYVLQTAQPNWQITGGRWTQNGTIPLFAASTIKINNSVVTLHWASTGPGRFETTIEDGDGSPVAEVSRTFSLGDNYDIVVRQSVRNRSDGPISVVWTQYGPGDLIPDRSRYMDRRRFRFGVEFDPVNVPGYVTSDDGDLLFERVSLEKRYDRSTTAPDAVRATSLITLWPDTEKDPYELSWFASTNRYFALAVHPTPAADGSVPVRLDAVGTITFNAKGPKGQKTVMTGLSSLLRTVPAGGSTDFDMGIYAGPLDVDVLDEAEPMVSLRMGTLILYQMSSFCAFCTFQWLAHLLLGFLGLVHTLTFDWGVAIIILVVVVRTLLHPITKKSQISMQRFGKVMSDLRPEIEKLQKKYGDDKKKIQQEQMRLFRERGANPLQMLGCLPMLLQTPIWIALYAMLYFAIEIRHEPAAWGLFQLIGGWPFLGDLSSADHCLGQFKEPVKFLIWNLTGINVLPILMGVVFYVQQKYMAPPPSPSMTPEQLQQQKIMKIMMVVMFPVMLYSAPSGLTLYIFTSSLFGIFESKYIRAHITDMDLKPAQPKQKTDSKKKPRDPQSRAMSDAIDRAKRRSKREPPPKKYKKRK